MPRRVGNQGMQNVVIGYRIITKGGNGRLFGEVKEGPGFIVIDGDVERIPTGGQQGQYQYVRETARPGALYQG